MPAPGAVERSTCTIGAVCADASCSRCIPALAEENAAAPAGAAGCEAAAGSGACSDAGAPSSPGTATLPSGEVPAPMAPAPAPSTPPARPCPAVAAVAVADQDLAITEIEFENDGSAEVQIQNVGTGLLSLGVSGIQLCNGADNCVFLSEDISITLLARNTYTLRIPDTSASGGELGLFFFGEGEEPTGYAFLAWGTGQSNGSLEGFANTDATVWSPGARVVVEPGDTTLVCVGPSNEASSFVSCRP